MHKQSQSTPLDVITDLLKRCSSDDTVFPPTDLFNEGWFLRLILEWFSRQRHLDHELAFIPGCRWFSEALLPSQFLARYRGDPLSESWTHADGVVGHVRIGRGAKADTTITPETTHLVVTEAKMFSKLSVGVKNASYFNQFARYAACIAELLSRANCKPTDLNRLGLYVLAPVETIGYGWFKSPLDRKDIRQRVERRVRAYEGEKDPWYQEWFLPTLDRMDIGCLSWESILDVMDSMGCEYAIRLREFYFQCLVFNRPTRAPTNYKHDSINQQPADI